MNRRNRHGLFNRALARNVAVVVVHVVHDPAVADRDFDVVLRREQIGDVIALYLLTGLVRRPAGRHDEVAEPFAVELRFVHTERRNFRHCRAHRLGSGKVLAEYGTDRPEIPCRDDEFCVFDVEHTSTSCIDKPSVSQSVSGCNTQFPTDFHLDRAAFFW